MTLAQLISSNGGGHNLKQNNSTPPEVEREGDQGSTEATLVRLEVNCNSKHFKGSLKLGFLCRAKAIDWVSVKAVVLSQVFTTLFITK